MGARQTASSDIQRLSDARRRSLVNPPKLAPKGFSGYGGTSQVRLPVLPSKKEENETFLVVSKTPCSGDGFLHCWLLSSG